MKSPSIHNALRQMSYGFRTRVATYGCYDVNGYRFRSEKYERKKSELTRVNSGVCVTSLDEDDNQFDYYGVIEDIIKITWEGRMKLELVLFDCRWFDPTSAGVRRTENLGLVEINHTSKLSNFDPFVMAGQVSQVYYLSYPCKTRRDLLDWLVVFRVPPRGYVPPMARNNLPQEPTHDVLFYQEDGLEGTFTIDIGLGLENMDSFASDEITDPKEIEHLEKLSAAIQEDEDEEEEEEDEEDEEDEDEEEEEEEYDEDEELQSPTYDPNDF